MINDKEFTYHKVLLVSLGTPENIISRIGGKADSANDVIKKCYASIRSNNR